jgi:hypothetical protein
MKFSVLLLKVVSRLLPLFSVTFLILQAVRMKGIQNKIIISQKAFIIHIYGLHHYKGKLSKFISDYITFSINSMWAPLVA